jgi:ABC-2 type transport system ATP-binding protein
VAQDDGPAALGWVKRLLGFAMVTVWSGRVVILDEPTNDVDPLRRRLLWDQIRALWERGYAVFLVTHNVMEAEMSVNRLAVVAGGRMMVPGMGTPVLPEWVRHHSRVGHNLIAGIGRADRPRGIGWAEELIGRGVAEEYALGATTLEDVYIRLTGTCRATASGRHDDGHGHPPPRPA